MYLGLGPQLQAASFPLSRLACLKSLDKVSGRIQPHHSPQGGMTPGESPSQGQVASAVTGLEHAQARGCMMNTYQGQHIQEEVPRLL
jgi:hypothetical protein